MSASVFEVDFFSIPCRRIILSVNTIVMPHNRIMHVPKMQSTMVATISNAFIVISLCHFGPCSEAGFIYTKKTKLPTYYHLEFFMSMESLRILDIISIKRVDMKLFQQRLIELRTDKQLSQKELARQIGVSDSAVCFWETGVNEPKASYLLQLSKFFNVSLDYLLGLEDDFGNISIEKNTPQLTAEENQLIEDFRALGVPGKQLIKTTMKTLLDTSSSGSSKTKKLI